MDTFIGCTAMSYCGHSQLHIHSQRYTDLVGSSSSKLSLQAVTYFEIPRDMMREREAGPKKARNR